MQNPLTRTTTLYLSQPPSRHQRGRWATLIREVQEGIVRSTRGDRSESESPTDPAQPKPARNAATAETQRARYAPTSAPGQAPARRPYASAGPPGAPACLRPPACRLRSRLPGPC